MSKSSWTKVGATDWVYAPRGCISDERADTWNDDAVAAAWSKDTPPEEKPFTVYAASKTEGERAAWKWIKEEKRGFTLNTVLPNMNVRLSLSVHCIGRPKLTDISMQYGRILSPEIPGSTMGWTRDLLLGDDKVLKMFPPRKCSWTQWQRIC